MISKKYLDDYTLDLKTDKNGKVTNQYVYTADYYCFDLEEQEIKSLRMQLLLYMLGIVVTYFVPLFIYSTLSKVLYVILPYILLLIPIYLLIQAIFHLYRNKGYLRREEKEKSYDRLKGIPYFMFFLLSFEIIAQILAYSQWSQEVMFGDYMLSAGTFFVLLFTFLLFIKTRNISLKTVNNENAEKIEKK